MATNALRDILQGASNGVAGNLTAPVDGINWLLRKVGVPVSDMPVGGSDWLRQKGLTAEPRSYGYGLLGEALGGVTPMLAAAKAPQIASGLLKAGDNMAIPNTMNPQAGAIVWHGSPHKFDKFDSSKIGTGEGAQAYGHGIYTAESPIVAKGYQDKLTDPAFKYAGMNDAKVRLNEKIAQRVEAIDPARAAALRAEVASLGEAGGSMYKIDLPDEHIAKMLDWDKPLSQQHPDVQKMLEPLGYSSKAQVSQYDDDLLAALVGDSSVALPKIRDPMGSEIARGGSLFDSQSQIGKATRLKELGIPGIRYLDGGSRGAGTGSSNFVVFPGNEGLLNILERNGQPINALSSVVRK